MGNLFILLIAMGVAQHNGLEIPVWAWLVTFVLVLSGILATIDNKIGDKK